MDTRNTNQRREVLRVYHDMVDDRLSYVVEPRGNQKAAQLLLDSAAMLFASVRAMRPDFTVSNLMSIAKPYSHEDDELIRGINVERWMVEIAADEDGADET